VSTQTRVADSLRSGMRMGGRLLGSLAESRLVGDLGRRVSVGGCCCEIPPPCWMPKSLGDVKSYVCAGGTAVLRLRVENCGHTSRSFTIEAAGADKDAVKLSPGSLTLGPMERAVATATVAVGAEARRGQEREALVWVRGCHDHVVRWTVKVEGGSESCHELDVADCPDYVHHWYDHFYCPRPCPNRG
jgi:hypothetical protein